MGGPGYTLEVPAALLAKQQAIARAQRLSRLELSGRSWATIARGDATQLRYELPPLDAVGEYLTCGDCGGRLLPNRHGLPRCEEGPTHGAARAPSPEQIRHARRIMAEALLARCTARAQARGGELGFDPDDCDDCDDGDD